MYCVGVLCDGCSSIAVAVSSFALTNNNDYIFLDPRISFFIVFIEKNTRHLKQKYLYFQRFVTKIFDPEGVQNR